jgi:hypothetical protein
MNQNRGWQQMKTTAPAVQMKNGGSNIENNQMEDIVTRTNQKPPRQQ